MNSFKTVALAIFLFFSGAYAQAQDIDIKFFFAEEEVHYLLVPNNREIGKTSIMLDDEKYLLITNESIPTPKITAVEGMQKIAGEGQYYTDKTISFIIIDEEDGRDYVDAFISNLKNRHKEVEVYNCGEQDIYNSLVIYGEEKKSGPETIEEQIKVTCYDYY